jgi:hypothetical protein
MPLHKTGKLVAGVLVAGSLALTACGSSGSSDPPASATILNTSKVETAIARSSLAQRGVTAQVICPSNVHQAEGSTFACTAFAEGDSTEFVVTQLDGSGNVHYEAR